MALREYAERTPAMLGMVAPPPLHITSSGFDGTLATLFRCVRDRKVDLLEVPLSPICEAYFDYLLQLPTLDLDEAGAAAVALTYLLERKAWALLPVPEAEPEEDEPAELLEPMVHEYQGVVASLRQWHEERSMLFFRGAVADSGAYHLPVALSNVCIEDLSRALGRLLARAEPEPVEPLVSPTKPISEIMRETLLRLSKEWLPITDLLAAPWTKTDAVLCFLALLELVRLGQASVVVEQGEALFSRAMLHAEGSRVLLEN